MTDNLKRLLRQVYSVDTEAGYRLRYHITRALACKDYAYEIGFEVYESSFHKIQPSLTNSFLWEETSEGHNYWAKIRNMVG